jgi:hypothetical protein
VLGLAPYARAGDAHRTEAEAVDDDIAADGELAGKAFFLFSFLRPISFSHQARPYGR